MNLKRQVSQALLQVYDHLEVERQVIGPVKQCTIDGAEEYYVKPSVEKCAGNIRCRWRCHQTVQTDFGSECWLLVRRLILNKLIILLHQISKKKPMS